MFNPHQRCGYSDSPFARKDTFLYCRVQKWVGRGWHPGHGDTKRKLYLRKRHVFVIEKCIEDAKQDEKDVPDLLESIMRPTCFVKEELRTNSCKSNGLQTRLTKKKSILLRRPRPWPGPGPRPRPGPLRRRMENIN